MGSSMRFIIYTIFFCLLAGVYSAELNSICRDGPVAWRCKAVDSCDTLDKDDSVQVCGFNGKPLVCCPPATPSNTPRRIESDNRSSNSNSSRN